MGNAGFPTAFTRAIGGRSTASGVRVVGVNPAPVLTHRVEVLGRKRAATQYGDENRWRESFAKMPYGRPASTDEIAATVVFLASDLSCTRAAPSSRSTAASPTAAACRSARHSGSERPGPARSGRPDDRLREEPGIHNHSANRNATERKV